MFRYKNLAPDIYRQRLVIEGVPDFVIDETHIFDYLSKLSDEIEMKILIQPVTSDSPAFGWAGWVHWETSGAHFYAWETPRLFFSIDIYTCKAFDPQHAVRFTKDYFKAKKITQKRF